jgi:hypothetical protein
LKVALNTVTIFTHFSRWNLLLLKAVVLISDLASLFLFHDKLKSNLYTSYIHVRTMSPSSLKPIVIG